MPDMATAASQPVTRPKADKSWYSRLSISSVHPPNIYFVWYMYCDILATHSYQKIHKIMANLCCNKPIVLSSCIKQVLSQFNQFVRGCDLWPTWRFVKLPYWGGVSTIYKQNFVYNHRFWGIFGILGETPVTFRQCGGPCDLWLPELKQDWVSWTVEFLRPLCILTSLLVCYIYRPPIGITNSQNRG